MFFRKKPKFNTPELKKFFQQEKKRRPKLNSPEQVFAYVSHSTTTSSHKGMCKNPTSLSVQDITQYSTDQLLFYVEDGAIYCFTFREIEVLINTGRNPFTDKEISEKFLNTLYKLRADSRYKIPIYPLEKKLFLSPGTCFQLPPLDTDNIGFINSSTPLTLETLPLKILVVYNPDEEDHTRQNDQVDNYLGDYKVFITNFFSTSVLGVSFIYQVELKKDLAYYIDYPYVFKKDILDMKEIFSSDKIETSPITTPKITIQDESIINELKEFMKSIGKSLSPEVLDKLSQLKIKEDKPVKVYRGLGFNNYSFVNRYSVGDTLYLYSRNRVQSWSTVHCVSQAFATRDFGMIVSTILDPQQIAIDTRLLNDSQRSTFYHRDQREIMSYPYEENGEEMKFLVKVEAIIYSRDKQEITDVKDLRYLVERPVKDLYICSYGLGSPISKVEALDNFLEKEYVSKDEVKLKLCGSVMLIKDVEELLERNKSTWQRRENTYIISPRGCIYGNIVRKEQLPGILVVEDNSHLVKLSYTDLYFNPYFYSDKKEVSIAYENTKGNRELISLLCESFKKGSLFKFEDEYVLRELPTREYLKNVGCTPYTMFFREEYKDDIYNPYPLEKKWNITSDKIRYAMGILKYLISELHLEQERTNKIKGLKNFIDIAVNTNIFATAPQLREAIKPKLEILRGEEGIEEYIKKLG